MNTQELYKQLDQEYKRNKKRISVADCQVLTKNTTPINAIYLRRM